MPLSSSITYNVSNGTCMSVNKRSGHDTYHTCPAAIQCTQVQSTHTTCRETMRIQSERNI